MTRSRSRARDDRGAVVVEAAIVIPLLLALVFGMIEIGGALKAYSSTSNAVRAGGRAASVAGNEALADQYILTRVAGEAAGMSAGEIEYVIIWNATGPGDTPPAACLNLANGAGATFNQTSLGVYDSGTSAVGACNIYNRPDDPGAAFDMARGDATQPPEYYFGCAGSPFVTTKLDCNWSPTHRKVVVSPRGTPAAQQKRPDYVGVYMKASHDYITGVLGDTLTITDSGINLLEPDSYGVNS